VLAKLNLGQVSDRLKVRAPGAGGREIVGEGDRQLLWIPEAIFAPGVTCDVIAKLDEDPLALPARDSPGAELRAEIGEPCHPNTASTACEKCLHSRRRL
jgi:hypothetical protein